jgi:hypothetical protein
VLCARLPRGCARLPVSRAVLWARLMSPCEDCLLQCEADAYNLRSKDCIFGPLRLTTLTKPSFWYQASISHHTERETVLQEMCAGHMEHTDKLHAARGMRVECP